jgi:hypothetical protein
MRIKGRGFHRKDGQRGDQMVTLQIRLPGDAGLLAKLAAELPDEPAIRSDLGV